MTAFILAIENQPVCVSVSSCLTPKASSILTSSLSSLTNAIFITDQSVFDTLYQSLDHNNKSELDLIQLYLFSHVRMHFTQNNIH